MPLMTVSPTETYLIPISHQSCFCYTSTHCTSIPSLPPQDHFRHACTPLHWKMKQFKMLLAICSCPLLYLLVIQLTTELRSQHWFTKMTVAVWCLCLLVVGGSLKSLKTQGLGTSSLEQGGLALAINIKYFLLMTCVWSHK